MSDEVKQTQFRHYHLKAEPPDERPGWRLFSSYPSDGGLNLVWVLPTAGDTDPADKMRRDACRAAFAERDLVNEKLAAAESDRDAWRERAERAEAELTDLKRQDWEERYKLRCQREAQREKERDEARARLSIVECQRKNAVKERDEARVEVERATARVEDYERALESEREHTSYLEKELAEAKRRADESYRAGLQQDLPPDLDHPANKMARDAMRKPRHDYYPAAGRDISEVARHLLTLAVSMKRPTTAEFNGFVLTADDGMTADDVMRPFFERQERLAVADDAKRKADAEELRARRKLDEWVKQYAFARVYYAKEDGVTACDARIFSKESAPDHVSLARKLGLL